ncbi:MAG: hypothetical protein JSV31_15185 [Desulfobacterales bacterium]|nr:MAG: hypothetical protein JSV31_15185 [Desulfobacterales bacterium]
MMALYIMFYPEGMKGRILKCDLESYKMKARILEANKIDRDLLIYLIWQLGVVTNERIGEKFGLTYSAVNRRVRIFKEMLDKDKRLQRKFKQVKSQIKI